MRVSTFLIVASLLLGVSASRAQDGAAAFTVGGVDVDFLGKTTNEARLAAYREAQRRAWPQLWSRLTGKPASAAPKLGDSALDQMVAGIEVQSERFSTRRYIARLGVVFDRVRASKYLGAEAQVLTSPPMLLLPVLNDGGTRTVYETQSPWLKAWSRYRSGATPMQYVRASNISGDAILLNAWQARRDNRQLWRSIMNRFRTADVLTAEAKLDRLYPGGPIVATFTARHGPDAELLARFRLRTASATGLETLLDEGVRRIDAVYADALRAGRLKSDPDLTADLAPVESAGPAIAVTRPASGVEAYVATPDAAALSAVQAALRGVPSVTSTSLISLSLGGMTRISIGHSSSYDWLLYNLDQRGWRLVPAQGGLLLRRRLPGDPAIPRPLTVEEIEAAAAAAGIAPAAASPPGTAATTAQRPAVTAPGAEGGPVDLLPGGPTP